MNILITGASGFLARQLVPALLQERHQLILLGRHPEQLKKIYKLPLRYLSWGELTTLSPDCIDCIIHLAGQSIGERRWTQATKDEIKSSRLDTTKMIVEWCSHAKEKKPHLYNASAIGVYGLRSNNSPALSEISPIDWQHPKDFLSEVGVAWETAANYAKTLQIPVTILRFGVMLKRHEGMLKKLELPFSLGLGSVIGDGEQVITWVHVNDVVAAILFLLKHSEVTGAVNITAPESVSQKVFAKILAQAMKRPLLFKTPAWIIKILFGQMGKELLLSGQRVYPEKLLSLGFTFTFPTLRAALSHEYKTNWPTSNVRQHP